MNSAFVGLSRSWREIGVMVDALKGKDYTNLLCL